MFRVYTDQQADQWARPPSGLFWRIPIAINTSTKRSIVLQNKCFFNVLCHLVRVVRQDGTPGVKHLNPAACQQSTAYDGKRPVQAVGDVHSLSLTVLLPSFENRINVIGYRKVLGPPGPDDDG
jgi:hypothetical protein